MKRRIAALLVFSLGACAEEAPATTVTQSGTQDANADYKLFAQRCSKCHALARPLQAHIAEDAGWARVVTRMRQKPESGISDRDEVAILRYLHVLAEQERASRPPPPEEPSK